jgi:hypothetical protein
MSVSYQICRDVYCQQVSISRVHCQAGLNTVRDVPTKDDASKGALAKAISSNSRTDPPVFVLHATVAIPEDGVKAWLKGIDVSYKATHYRIHLRMHNRDWHAFRITTLPPMLYFDTVSREVATQIARTQLLVTTLAGQIAPAPPPDVGFGENYANAVADPADYGAPMPANH